MRPIFDLPIYVAGGHTDKATAGAVADLLEARYHVRVTFPWWKVDQAGTREARDCARSELRALCSSSVVIALDAHAGTGTAFECGYFYGRMAAAHDPKILVRVRLENDPGRLDWFFDANELGGGKLLRTVTAHEWSPASIMDAIALYAPFTEREPS